jgi:hypothetical protein
MTIVLLQKEIIMADEKIPEKKKKGLPTIAKVGIGCVGCLVLVLVLFGAAGGFIFSKLGMGLFNKGLEQATGLSVNQNKEGFTFKDGKTGAEVNVGLEKMPDNFPSDFPVYPGSKPAGTLSGMGGENNSADGFWVVLTTTDSVDKVQGFYTSKLKENSWTIVSTTTVSGSTIWTVTKGDLEGSLTVATDNNAKGTSIVIALGSKK